MGEGREGGGAHSVRGIPNEERVLYVECIYSVKNAECLRHVVCDVCVVSMNFQRAPCFFSLILFSFLFFTYIHTCADYGYCVRVYAEVLRECVCVF